jgi:hypothetical protein
MRPPAQITEGDRHGHHPLGELVVGGEYLTNAELEAVVLLVGHAVTVQTRELRGVSSPLDECTEDALEATSLEQSVERRNDDAKLKAQERETTTLTAAGLTAGLGSDGDTAGHDLHLA